MGNTTIEEQEWDDVEDQPLLYSISLDEIDPNPLRTIVEENINDLRESIKKYGVLQPILVRPKKGRYEIIFGNHRYYASKGAGLEEIPAMIKEVSDRDMILLSITENVQRLDLEPYEAGKLFVELLRTHAYTIKDVAELIGKGEAYVKRRVDIYKNLHQDLVQKIGKTLTISNAWSISRLEKDKQLIVSKNIERFKTQKLSIPEKSWAFCGNCTHYDEKKKYCREQKAPVNSFNWCDTGFKPRHRLKTAKSQGLLGSSMCNCPKCGAQHLKKRD